MTEDEREVARLLREAAVRVAAAITKLDLSHKMCEGCHRVHHHNYDHKRIFDQLETMAPKMERAAAFLEEDPKARETGRQARRYADGFAKRSTR